MAIREPKPEVTRNIPNFISFGDKTLSSLGYIAWLKNATVEFKKAYSSIPEINSTNAEEVEKMGNDLIIKIVEDNKNLEISSLDREYGEVAAAKEPMLNMVELIKQKCGIVKLSNNNNVEAINIAPIERPLSAEKPITGIERVSYEQIQNEARQINLLVEELKKESLVNLDGTIANYNQYKNTDRRLAGLIAEDFNKLKEYYASYIDKRLSEIPESEHLEIETARGDLRLLKKEIMEMDIDSVEEIGDTDIVEAA